MPNQASTNAARVEERGRAICWGDSSNPYWSRPFCPGREFTVGITGTGDDADGVGRSARSRQKANYVGDGYGFENKEVLGRQGRYPSAQTRCGESSGRRGAGRMAGPALPRWRAHRHPQRCAKESRISSRSIRWPACAPIIPTCASSPITEASRYAALIGMIMDAFLKRHPELRP